MRILLPSAAALLVSFSALADEAPAPAAEAPAPAMKPAETRPAASSPHLAAAMRLYQKLDLDAALAELSQAEATTKDSEDETVQVLIYRGLVFSDQGKGGEALDQFKRALAIRPWAEVPPETSPRIAKTFSDARKSIWGMASVKPPQRRVRPATNAVPASTPQEPPKAEPAVAK